MGGKSKQAQRTKNNARPSSSGRSAELLGTFNTGVVGGTALFPTLAAAAAPDITLTPDLALCIKKLNKKDPITKTKALQELNELVQNNKVDDVVAMLPSWTYFYKILTVDPDRRVRELTQICHGTIVGVCGRRVAPQLKALLPSWLAAQHDEHAPASSRAQLTLSSTFPENKLPEAISFCKTEVLTHMIDNILDCSASVSKKLDNEEERLAAATRVSCGALGGLRYLLQRLPRTGAHDEWLWAELASLLKGNAFWKLAGHSAPEVRSAWYNAIGALAERFGAQWGSAHGVRTLKLLLQVKETGGTAHALWAALLSNLIADPEWYTRLDKKDLLTKRIIESLECGGWGSARAMCEALPRLVALLPDAALTRDFCTQLFDACFAGLEKRNIISSKSERNAWITGIGECIRVLAERTDLPTEIAPAALGRWLRCVLGHSAPHIRAALVASVQPMLCGWACIPRLELVVRAFWQSAAHTVAAQLHALDSGAEDNKLPDLLHSHTLLLLTLHEALQQKPKKKKGVTFSDDNEQLEDNTETEQVSTEGNKSSLQATQLLRHQLDECVQRVCAQYMEVARGGGGGGGRVRVVLQGLLPVLQLLATEEVWAAMGAALTGGPATPYSVWEHGLLPWLRAERTRCEAAVRAAFLLLPHLTDHQQAAVFANTEELEPPFADWALPHSVQCALPCARAWVRSAPARAALLRATRAALAGDSAARDTLTACLTPDHQGEIPASEETVSEVLQLVSYVIQSGTNTNSAVVALSARLVTLLAHHTTAGTDDILAALFRHDLNEHNEQTETTERDSDTRVAWREGVRALPADKQKPLVQRLVKLLREHIHTDSADLEPSRILRCASLSAALACSSADGGATVTELMLEGDDNTLALTHALRLDIVAGRMNCPFDDVELVRLAISDTPELTVPAFLPFARMCVLRAAHTRALAEMSPRSPLESDRHVQVYMELLHRHAIVRALNDGYAFSPVYRLIAATEQQLSSIISDITSLTPENILHRAYELLAERAVAEGFYWACAAALYAAEGSKVDYSTVLTGDGFFHGLQAEMRLKGSDASPERLYAAYATMLRTLRAAHATQDPELSKVSPHAPPSADVVVDAYYRREQSMLYDAEIHSAPWSDAVCAASVADFLCELVALQGWEAPAHHWDFTTISLSSLLGSLDKSKDHWGTVKVAMVSRAVLRLLAVVSGFIRAVPSAALQRQPSQHVAALPREWADVFAPTCAHHAHCLLLCVLGEAEKSSSQAMSVCQARVIAALCEGIQHVRWSELPPASRALYSLERIARLAAAVLAAPVHHGHKYLAYCTLRALHEPIVLEDASACPYMVERGALAADVLVHHGHKYLAYCTLRALHEPIVLEDAEKLRAWSAAKSEEEGEEGEGAEGAACPPLALDYFDAALRRLQELVDAALAHLRVGEDTCETVPYSDTHSLALGWLLLVESLGSLAPRQRGDLALHYSELVKQRRYTELLLPSALRLLPLHVAAYATDPATNLAPPKDANDLFLKVKEFTIDEPSAGSDVAALACRALFTAVSGYGAGAARGWWGAATNKESRVLARLVKAYVTPYLVKTQLKAVAERGPKDLPDCDVTVHWSSGEVTCCVYVEERRVELSVALSPTHPLSLPRVSAPPPHQHSPAPNTHWLAVYLAYQNGSLLNALRMWVSAVTARVEAAPQCYICYCRLHPSTGRLPSVPCHQCRNNFHPNCLRKWFTSSNKSNCPLCRASF